MMMCSGCRIKVWCQCQFNLMFPEEGMKKKNSKSVCIFVGAKGKSSRCSDMKSEGCKILKLYEEDSSGGIVSW
jgi:hypothetical protein